MPLPGICPGSPPHSISHANLVYYAALQQRVALC